MLNEREREILRNERIRQIQIALSQRAGLADAIERRFGEEGVAVIKAEVSRDIRQWVLSVKHEHHEKQIKQDLDGLHTFLWEPNRDEQIIFRYKDQEHTRTYYVEKCPIAEFAHQHNLTKWGREFFCETYELIAKTYNEHFQFTVAERIMDHQKWCVFSHILNEKKLT
jgi:hypothetical protein